MFRLETFRLIKKTFRRFLSLTMIVFIGAGFMMGLMSTPDVLRESIDRFYDEYELSDVVIYSPYGFCNEDYVKIAQTEGVKDVFASREIDCHGKREGGGVSAFRISELNRKNNFFNLIEGRLPQAANECLYLFCDYRNNYGIGDRIIFDYGEEDIHDYLKVSEYTIVGIFESPQYISKLLGASNYNNEEMEGVFLVPNVNFVSDYFTTMYITLDDSKEIMSNTVSYDNFIKNRKVVIENLASEQQSYYRDRLVAEATLKLEDKEKLFEEVKNEGKKQLDDAKKQLDEANIQIIAYETQLTSLEAVIKSLQAAIEADMPLLQSIYGYTVQVEGGIDDILETIGLDGIYAVSGTMEYLYHQYKTTINQFNSIRGQLNSAKAQYVEGLKKYEESLEKYNTEIEEAEEELKLARAKLNDLPKSEWVILTRDQQYGSALYKNTCLQMGTIGTYLPIMFFLVAALVCLTTMKRLVDEQRGQIGVYVALGYSNTQIIGKYVTYALLASLIGGIPGVIVGQMLFPAVIYNTWRMLYFLPSIVLSFPIRNVIISIGLFSLLMGSITAYVVNETVKDVPASLMRPVAPKKGKEIALEKIPFLWNMLSFTSKITARNLFRYKSRALMTIAGIGGCAGLLILGFGIKDSVADVVPIQYGEIFRYDYIIYLKDDDHIEENLIELKKNPNVDYATSFMEYTTRIYLNGEENTANTIVIDPEDSHILLELKESDRKTPIRLDNNGVVISEQLAKNYNLKVGDSITIESRNRIKQDVQISNICEMYFQHYLIMTDTLYQNTFDEKVSNAAIAINSSVKNDTGQFIKGLQDYSSSLSIAKFQESFNLMVGALDLIIVIIILVAGSLAFVVLINLTQVNISERIREIATLKVLGFNDHEVNMYIFKEIMLLSMIGCLVGIPIGILEHRFIMTAISMEMIKFPIHINFMSYIYGIIITLVFTVIVLTFMRRPLRKVNMVESLKSVE